MKQFTEEQLVSFGNYLLANGRTSDGVHDADIANWKETQSTGMHQQREYTGYYPTCYVSGRHDGLKMLALRNDIGDMVGWIFVSDCLDSSDVILNRLPKQVKEAIEQS